MRPRFFFAFFLASASLNFLYCSGVKPEGTYPYKLVDSREEERGEFWNASVPWKAMAATMAAEIEMESFMVFHKKKTVQQLKICVKKK